MKQLINLILLLLLPGLGHAALLKYEFEFTPWSWPTELSDKGLDPSGTGHLIADTELNAIVSGELVSELFHFVWTDTAPSEMTVIDTYYGWDIISGGSVTGVDRVSGVAGSFSMVFNLPPGLLNYSESLHQHLPEDVWCDLVFPDYGPPADQWEYFYLGLEMTMFEPEVLRDVPGPQAFALLTLGLVTLAGVRMRARKTLARDSDL